MKDKKRTQLIIISRVSHEAFALDHRKSFSCSGEVGPRFSEEFCVLYHSASPMKNGNPRIEVLLSTAGYSALSLYIIGVFSAGVPPNPGVLHKTESFTTLTSLSLSRTCHQLPLPVSLLASWTIAWQFSPMASHSFIAPCRVFCAHKSLFCGSRQFFPPSSFLGLIAENHGTSFPSCVMRVAGTMRSLLPCAWYTFRMHWKEREEREEREAAVVAFLDLVRPSMSSSSRSGTSSSSSSMSGLWSDPTSREENSEPGVSLADESFSSCNGMEPAEQCQHHGQDPVRMSPDGECSIHRVH